MKAMLLATLCALALIACRGGKAPHMAPVVRGELITPGAGRVALSQQQLNGCIEWLNKYQGDWAEVHVLPPSPTYSAVFRHADEARTHVELYTGKAGWDETLLVRSFDKNGKLIFSGIENFSGSEITELRACTGTR